ncbi:MAG: indole-3-glycerol phosphate synthase TrpC [Anaerolineae bacterium]
MWLDQIIAHTRDEVARREQIVPLSELEVRCADSPPPLDFLAALRGPGVSLIAEVKRASPSHGLLLSEFDPVYLAMTYAQNGAAAISVLTEERFFQGSLLHLSNIKAALQREGLSVPLLRKDFILTAYQVYEARAFRADAILLIVAALDEGALAGLLALAEGLGLASLVEVHSEDELSRALPLKPGIIGINNRDLSTFQVNLETTFRLCPLIPAGTLVVSESGIRNRQDVERLGEAGVDAVLVGEALVAAADVVRKVRELAGR